MDGGGAMRVGSDSEGDEAESDRPLAGLSETVSNLNAACARTLSRGLALYFSRPVRLFRPAKGPFSLLLRTPAHRFLFSHRLAVPQECRSPGGCPPHPILHPSALQEPRRLGRSKALSTPNASERRLGNRPLELLRRSIRCFRSIDRPPLGRNSRFGWRSSRWMSGPPCRARRKCSALA